VSQRMSTSLCNALWVSSFKAIFDGLAELRIWAGTPPVSADAAIAGQTLLVTVNNGGVNVNMDTGATGGVISKKPTETWGGTNAASGTASFYRFCLHTDANGADAGGTSVATPRLQGLIATGGSDMNLGVTALVAAAPFAIQFFTQSFVPS
jgi:hypothetical protein